MMRVQGQDVSDNDGSSGTEVDDMIEADNTSLRERVNDLEKKVLDQGDEIVCLRSTLANVVRRLEQVEGLSRTDDVRLQNSHRYLRNGSAGTPPYKSSIRPPGYITTSATDAAREPSRRPSRYLSSGLPQRKQTQTHYQSTGSLHSQHSNHSNQSSQSKDSNQSNHSIISDSQFHSHSHSSSVSPVPTVASSPSPTTSSNLNSTVLRNNTNRLNEPARSISQTSTPVRTNVNSNFHNSKRWSSTGDFGVTIAQSPHVPNHSSRLSAKSLLNLSKIHASHNQSGVHYKHGPREAAYDENEGALRMYLRGRPIIFYSPSILIESYNVASVAPPPSQRLKLDWVYGYRGRDCRSNLYFLPTGEMVYFIAAVAVLYNVDEQTQRHYLGHTDDIKCLAIHPNKMFVATGQCAGHDRRDARPHVRIWNSVSLNTIAVIGVNEFDKSVSCLSFSKADGGSLLCAVDDSPDHIISVWDWQKGEQGAKITETKCSVDTVIAAEFHPLDRNSIITCGKSHVNFWTLDQSGTLYKRMGIFENRDKPKYVTCVAFLQNGDVLTGDTNGTIIVWGLGANTILKLVKGLHEGPVFSLCVTKEGNVVSGGGKDGRLIVLDADLEPTGEETVLGEAYGGVRQISEGRGEQLLIGTTKNCIVIGSINVGLSRAVVGHTEEIWGCAVHPSLAQFATGGFDSMLCLWDSMSHSLVWTKKMPEQLQSIGFSPDGSILIVGLITGKWLSLDLNTRETLDSHSDGSEPIQTIRFAPNGQLVALGSRDNTIYVYQLIEGSEGRFSRVGRCIGHSSFITHLDWSSDSQIIRSNSGDYELLFWQADVCRQLTQTSSLRDVEWATNYCTLTFQTIGIWPEGGDGTDVNFCARSSDCRLLVTADDFGKVKLFSYPVMQPKSLCHIAGGHSSHVTHVEFLQDDSRIISTGGKDMSILQWRLS